MLEILFEVLFACDQLQTGLLCETSISIAAPPPPRFVYVCVRIWFHILPSCGGVLASGARVYLLLFVQVAFSFLF